MVSTLLILLIPRVWTKDVFTQILDAKPSAFISFVREGDSEGADRHFIFLNSQGKAVLASDLPSKYALVALSANGDYVAASGGAGTNAELPRIKSWVTVAGRNGIVYEGEFETFRSFRWVGNSLLMFGQGFKMTHIKQNLGSETWSNQPFLDAESGQVSPADDGSLWFVRNDVPKTERKTLVHVTSDGKMDKVLTQRSELPGQLVAASNVPYLLYVDFFQRVICMNTNTKKEIQLTDDQYGTMAYSPGAKMFAYVELVPDTMPKMIFFDPMKGKKQPVKTEGLLPWTILPLDADHFLVVATPVAKAWTTYRFLLMDARTGASSDLEISDLHAVGFPLAASCR